MELYSRGTKDDRLNDEIEIGAISYSRKGVAFAMTVAHVGHFDELCNFILYIDS